MTDRRTGGPLGVPLSSVCRHHGRGGRRRGITLLELAVTILLGSLVVGIAFGFLSRVRSLYSHGTVNLQNLQDAQLAINSIRRDFFSACPFFGQKVETLAEFQIYEKTRRRVFDFGAGVEKAGLGNNRLILFNSGSVSSRSNSKVVRSSVCFMLVK